MIDFNNLKPLHQALAGEIQEAVRRVLDRGWYVLGPEVEAFEAAFAAAVRAGQVTPGAPEASQPT